MSKNTKTQNLKEKGFAVLGCVRRRKEYGYTWPKEAKGEMLADVFCEKMPFTERLLLFWKKKIQELRIVHPGCTTSTIQCQSGVNTVTHNYCCNVKGEPISIDTNLSLVS